MSPAWPWLHTCKQGYPSLVGMEGINNHNTHLFIALASLPTAAPIALYRDWLKDAEDVITCKAHSKTALKAHNKRHYKKVFTVHST